VIFVWIIEHARARGSGASLEHTELEILEGAGFGEITVLDALEAKSRAALFRASLRDFLVREHQLDATTPDRVRHTVVPRST
jgi:hypothetical protein